MAEGWYWCLAHKKAEPAEGGCANDQRMGPYPTAEEATHWKEKVEERNQVWEDEDRRWEEGS